MDQKGILGVVLGLVTAFFIGLFMVPRRYARSDNVTFLLGMMAGAAVGSAAYWLVAGAPWQWSWAVFFSLVPGVNWAVGSYAYAFGTERIGLAKATGIKNTQVVVTTVGGFVFFHERASTEPVSAVIGAALVVATAVYLSWIEHREESLPSASPAGYLVPIIASILYGVNGVFMKLLIVWNVPRPLANLGIGLGALLGGVALYVLTGRRFCDLPKAGLKNHFLALAGGVTWALGLVTMILSIDYAGLAVGWSLMNLSVVVSVLYGVVVLREIDLRRRWGRVAIGLVLACLGIAALYLSKLLPAVAG